MRHTLWERLLPQARELIEGSLNRYPATTEVIMNSLKDNKYHMWSELPYYVVRLLSEAIFGIGGIEEDEINTLFEKYYEQ